MALNIKPPFGATNRKELRERFVAALENLVGGGISWLDPQYPTWTGLNPDGLRKDWNHVPPINTTCCQQFAQKVAMNMLGLPAGLVLTSAKLDLSGVDRDVPGSWVYNGGEAAYRGAHPLPGDFYCASKPFQKYAHVGIVVKCDSEDDEWKWIAGGQGSPPHNDYIRKGPGYWDPTASKHFREGRSKVPGWVDIGWYFFPKENPPTDRKDDLRPEERMALFRG